MPARDPLHNHGQVALQMQSEGQKIGYDENAGDATFDELVDSLVERGMDRFQEPDLHQEAARLCRGLGNRLDRLALAEATLDP